MKFKKIIFIIKIIFLILILFNVSKAYTISADDKNVKEGEEFTIILTVDEDTPLANGNINFDSSKIEFVRATQEGMTAAVKEDGVLAWIFVNVTPEGELLGTKQFEFVFKAKSSESSKMTLDGLKLVDINRNEYTVEQLDNPKTVILINEKKSNVIIPIAIIIIVVIIFIVILHKKKVKSK